MSHASKSSLLLCIRALSIVSTRQKARMMSALAVLTLVGGAMLAGCDGGGSTTGTPGAGAGAGKGVVNATFSNASGTNANTTAFQSNIAQGLTSSGAGGFTLLNITGPSISGATSRTFAISLAENGAIQTGKTYTFSATGVNSVSTLTYTQAGLSGAPTWIASGGSAIVDSITGKNYKLHFTNVTFTTGADNNSGATGSFTVNGTADVTLP